MSQYLEMLTSAISESGVWFWWDQALPEAFQVDFIWTQLYTPPEEDNHPPMNPIALRFYAPTSISFLTQATERLPADWPGLFYNQQLGPFHVGSHRDRLFTLEDNSVIDALLAGAEHINTAFGSEPHQVDWVHAPAKLAFAFGVSDHGPVPQPGSNSPALRGWMGGIAIAAERMAVVLNDSELEPDAVKKLYRRWLLYWGQYWQCKAGPHPLPEDPVCEASPFH